jgi:hypothetical protein
MDVMRASSMGNYKPQAVTRAGSAATLVSGTKQESLVSDEY